MEEIGPDAPKRPRLDSFGGASSAHRMHQQHSESPLPLHGYQGQQALRPPSAYSQPLPPSPYDPVGEQRSLPEPPQHSYSHPPSGYNTPGRDPRQYQPDPSYSRQGSIPAPTRSPDEALQSTGLRPINTASANEGQHFQSLGHPDAIGPIAPPTGYVPHEGYPNGIPHGLPMSSHLDPSQRPPPPPPILPGTYTDSPVGSGPGGFGVGPYGGPPPDSPWGRNMQMGARKSARAQQACDTCRARKARCDEGKPACAYCKEQHLPCNYKEVAPAKADRAQREIMDQLAAVREEYKHIKALLDELVTSSKAVKQAPTESLTPKLEISPTSQPRGVPGQDPKAMALRPESGNASSSFDQQHTDGSGNGGDDFGSIAVDHTTGVHRLLQWETIKAMVVTPKLARENYVMEMEEKKGLLRVYGRGQGRDMDDGGTEGPASPASNSSSGRSEEVARSPGASPSDLYGYLRLPSPPVSDGRDWPQDHVGGLNPDGSLKLDRQTIYRLLASYFANMHILHPFLNRTRLARMFERVACEANPTEGGTIRSPFVTHNTVLGPDGSLNKATKRKYSSAAGAGSPGEVGPSGPPRGGGEQAVQRKISTAIVLLVMALGKICEYKDNLPGPVPDYKDLGRPLIHSPRPFGESPPGNSVKGPSPTMASSVISSPYSDPRSIGMSRLTSSEPQTAPRAERNIDVIPGFAYYARATDLLGNMHGGNGLGHVQANLLACLYASQLACPIESWCYIQTACRACYFLIRDPKLEKERDKVRADSIRFAYWTCLQLESDILAELDLRRSGIEEIELAFPRSASEYGPDWAVAGTVEERILFFYYAQIGLRTTMNKIQKTLYPPNAVDGRLPWTIPRLLASRSGWETSLAQWWQSLRPGFEWDEINDPPSDDINVARLRAKYYGAKYLIHRPFLNHALHSMNPQGDASGIRNQAMDANGEYRNEVLRSAKLCLEAAMRSTEAFDGVMRVHGRLIVTNIFGTAHAQFGNMLVLVATQRSWLSTLIEKSEVVRLLDRTVRFLDKLAPISTTLAADAEILKRLRKNYYFQDESLPASSSFTSAG